MSKKVVRVHFIDGSSRAFAVDINASAHNLREIVVEKIGLKEDGCFALFEKRDDWERCLEHDEKPVEIMEAWEKLPGRGKGKDDETAPVFLFKKKIFLKDDDREMEDPVAKDLVYKQALNSVIVSDYPCQPEDAIRLAGLQMQSTYKDHNPAVHSANFLTTNNLLKNFVPKALFALKKPTEWESAILRQHAANRGKSPDAANTEYLDIVKQWPYYGTTFFPPCKSLNNRNLPAKVIIGVNYEGIRLLKPKNKDLISEHLFTEICSWASSSGTFAFEFGNQTDSTKYQFETKQGAIIAATIQTYIDILVQMLKNSEDDDDGSETGTSGTSDTENH